MMRQWTAFAIAAVMMCCIAGTSHDAYGYPIPDEGDAKLSLNPASPCFDDGVGGTVTINVDVTDLPEIAVGAQFFLEYDTSMLDFISIEPGESPFVTEIDEEVDEGLGHIDYGVGIPIDLSLPGTSEDTTIAVITFQALQETCDMTGLISFRPTGPSGAINKLSNPIGMPIVPVLHALAGGMIDGTAPAITCPANVLVECDADSSSAATGVATATDTCDAAPIIAESDSIAAGSCPQAYVITRTWTATDACGNVAACEQIITVQDTTPPAFDQMCPLPDIDVVADAGVCETAGTTVSP